MSIFVTASLIMAVIAILYAIYLAVNVIKQPAGNEKMQMISSAIAEGAKAYLFRQNKTIAYMVVIL